MASSITGFRPGHPTRGETVAAVAIIPVVVTNLLVGESAPAWVVVGIVLAAIGVGPLASSRIGSAVGTWFESIGVAGRVLAIVGFAAVVTIGAIADAWPATELESLATGVMIAAVGHVALEAIVGPEDDDGAS